VTGVLTCALPISAEDIKSVLEYLKGRKIRLESALAEIEKADVNHICTTDQESRLLM
jgi:hypothetical protein